MSTVTYEASIYTRTISYKNLKGETKEVELHFALDPIQLLRVIASVPAPKKSKSGNPAQRASDESSLTEEQSFKFLVDISAKAAGWPSDDGESFEPFEDFATTLAGKAFITKLAASDADREEFAKKVILDPFAAFINFAAADESNNAAEVKKLRDMLSSMERIFATSAETKNETPEEKRARLLAEIDSLENN